MWSNLNIQNLMLMFTFSVFNQKYLPWVKLKRDTWIKSNIQNSNSIFTFPRVLTRFTLFLGKFGRKNLVQICVCKLKFLA